VKLIRKKDKLPRVTEELKQLVLPARDVVELKRRTERVLSLVLLALLSHRLCLEQHLDEDFSYFSRPLLESAAVQDVHWAFLVLSKGVLAPNYEPAASSMDVQTLVRRPYPTLLSSYRQGMAAAGQSQFSRSFRMLFPLASTCLRCRSILAGTSTTLTAAVGTHLLLEDQQLCEFATWLFKAEGDAVLGSTADELLTSIHRLVNSVFYNTRTACLSDH
jgi:hypothetical protein